MTIKITLTDDEALALLHDLSMVLEDPVEPALAKLWNSLLPADARRAGNGGVTLLRLPETEKPAFNGGGGGAVREGRQGRE